MSEAKPYTREELATISHGDTEFSYDQCPECGQDCGRWLATLAAVEAERDAALAEVERLREALVRWADANDELRRAHLLLGMEDKKAELRFRAAADALMVIARAALAPQPEVKGEHP